MGLKRMMKSIVSLLVLFCGTASAADQPNILWLTSEDNNVNWVGCYGNPHAETPNIDALAAEGFQYMHCYSNAPVCAPSRSTWITGVPRFRWERIRCGVAIRFRTIASSTTRTY